MGGVRNILCIQENNKIIVIKSELTILIYKSENYINSVLN